MCCHPVRACISCPIFITSHKLLIRLHVMSMNDYDVILGMDFVPTFHTVVDYYAKKVVFKILIIEFTFYGSDSASPPHLISTLQAQKLLLGGFPGFLIMIIDDKSEGPVLDDIPMVKEFSDVFPEDLPSLPLDREVEYFVDLVLRTKHISKASYKMAHTELKELKK